MSIRGSCLCGKIRYEINGALCHVTHCHCSMCRRQHGAAFATYAQFDPSAFKWVAGEEQVKVFETPEKAGWCFCRECGSTLAGTDNGEVTSVTLGSVEGDPGVKPEAHIFTASKACWYEISDGLIQYSEWPKNDS